MNNAVGRGKETKRRRGTSSSHGTAQHRCCIAGNRGAEPSHSHGNVKPRENRVRSLPPIVVADLLSRRPRWRRRNRYRDSIVAAGGLAAMLLASVMSKSLGLTPSGSSQLKWYSKPAKEWAMLVLAYEIPGHILLPAPNGLVAISQALMMILVLGGIMYSPIFDSSMLSLGTISGNGVWSLRVSFITSFR
nr:hypothetical protein Iba_chr13fCG7000 [Ipomoea batatas]